MAGNIVRIVNLEYLWILFVSRKKMIETTKNITNWNRTEL